MVVLADRSEIRTASCSSHVRAKDS